MAQIISITEAKQKLLELARRNDELGESFVVVKDSVPVSAIIPFDEYESMLETLDILETEPDVLKKLKAAEKEIAAGKGVPWKSSTKRATRRRYHLNASDSYRESIAARRRMAKSATNADQTPPRLPQTAAR